MHWRRKWRPTPVFLPGEFQGWGSLVGCRLWGCTEWTWLKWLSSSSKHILEFPWWFSSKKSACLHVLAIINSAALMYRTVLWTLWETERVGRFGRMALKHVKYHVWNELPVQVRCAILDAWGWCTGMTQRDGMGREEGGGFRMGNTCIPVADSFWYLAKLIQLCKV